MSNTLYEVKVDCEDCTMGPHSIYITVIAEDGHEALDKATDHPNASRLWDEEIQRAIVDGEIAEHRVERKYENYIREMTYVGQGYVDNPDEVHVDLTHNGEPSDRTPFSELTDKEAMERAEEVLERMEEES